MIVRTGLILIRDFLLAALVLLVVSPLWFLPWDAAADLGRFYGYCAFFFWPGARRAGMINLRRAYGADLNYATARNWIWQVFGNMGQSIAEGIQFSRRFKGASPEWEQIYECDNRELEARLLRDPRPKVFVTGHLGSWEVGAMMLALRVGKRGAAVARRVDNPFLNAIVRQARLQDPAQWIEKTGAVAECLRRLQQGDSIALLFDENGGWRGSFVDFFGRPASTRKTAALLALTTGAPIVIGAALRKPGKKKFLFKLAEIEPHDYGTGPEAILGLTQAMVTTYEQWVREYPLQWRWIHWRWKNRPGGEEETYRRSDLKRCFNPDGAPGEAKRSPEETASSLNRRSSWAVQQDLRD